MTEAITMEPNLSLQLADFDWSLKYVMGSSSLSTLEQPLVNLIFHLAKRRQTTEPERNPTVFKTISLELDKNELKLLIDELEKANQSS